MNQKDKITEATSKILYESYVQDESLNDTECTCVDEVVSTYKLFKGKKDLQEIVDDVVGRYNEANTLPEYEDEEFYQEEANYDTVLRVAKKELNLTEQLDSTQLYDVYITYRNNGSYDSNYVTTVDNIEQAADKVAELQAETGCNAYYEPHVEKQNNRYSEVYSYKGKDFRYDYKSGMVDFLYDLGKGLEVIDSVGMYKNNWEDKKLRNEYLDDWIGDLEGETNRLAFYELEEDATQCSNVASGVNGKIDSFPIHPKNKKKNESYIPNTFNTPCPKCGSNNFLEIDDEELEDGTQCYHLTCQDCGYTQRDEYNPLDESLNLKNNRDADSEQEYENRISNSRFDIQKMEKLKKYDDIKAFLYELIENLSYDRAKSLLCSYLTTAIIREEWGEKPFEKIRKAIEEVLKVSFNSVPTSKELWGTDNPDASLVSGDSSDKFDDREELLNYLNKNTDYAWDVNETYDNCVILEDPDIDDYIEVFVEIKDGNKTYSITDNNNVNEYNSLPEMLDGVKTLIANK